MAYSTIGLQLAITILLFIYVGYKADEHFRSSPWLFILSVVLGMTAGFYNLIRELRNIDRFLENKPAADSQDGEKRTKWL
ncbi:MAG TPA: AtpZ/AtpI family protein [Spirochaetota bacterium]|nr:AtpZ/AtpI family protein [Spirochaetota bacterium]HNT11352.1 AtpZ/AtpI family protein [Spirochaetota bacterium]HNV47178.1 AtpZ/AtpI family protein [Spirochaetota bacterium]HOS38741.1 AtpZ/AtpI family protein [Spirochaetota bacterium]HPI21936.1 AtpZ/AtpI family protein [Spirochaetota bacterium]